MFALRIVVLAGCAMFAAPLAVRAQTIDSSQVDAALARLDRERACLDTRRRELEETRVELRRADSQASVATTAAARDAARASVAALIARAARTEHSIARCRDERFVLPAAERFVAVPPSQTTSPTPAPGQHPPSEAVGEEPDSPRIVERNSRISTHVVAIVGERVDGSANIPHERIRAAVHLVGAQLESCFEASEEPIIGNDLTVVFTVGAASRPTRVVIEDVGRAERTVRRCVERVFTTMSVPSAPRDTAMYSYSLRIAADRAE